MLLGIARIMYRRPELAARALYSLLQAPPAAASLPLLLLALALPLIVPSPLVFLQPSESPAARI